MNGDAVVIGDHVSLLLIEFAFDMIFISFKKRFEIAVLRYAAEHLFMKLFYDLEVGDAENEKISGILSYKWAYNALRAQAVKVQDGGNPLMSLLANQTEPVGIPRVEIAITSDIVQKY